ncbi:MAG: FHA domain-containing protein [Blastocatellia bacterium]|nr:FHA domain-containing protein [Blastocatellia bacterium]
MSEHQSLSLQELEHFLRLSIEANYWLTFADVNPAAIVEQIEEQLTDRRFEFLDGATYVPNLLTVYVMEPHAEKLEEVEVLFNSMVFMKYLYEYITESGYKLFDFMRVEIKFAEPDQRELGGPCYLFFDWPAEEESLEQVTAKFDTGARKILEVCEPKPEIPRLARLTALNAEVYRNDYTITRPTVFMGRLRNVMDKATNQVIRRNDFVFARQHVPDSVNASVSRQHAKVVFEDGEFFFYDTGSANGSSVERAGAVIDVPISTNFRQRVQLYDGDVLCLGGARVRFELIHSPDQVAGRMLMSGDLSYDTNEHLANPDDAETIMIRKTQKEEELERTQ